MILQTVKCKKQSRYIVYRLCKYNIIVIVVLLYISHKADRSTVVAAAVVRGKETTRIEVQAVRAVAIAVRSRPIATAGSSIDQSAITAISSRQEDTTRILHVRPIIRTDIIIRRKCSFCCIRTL